MVRAVQPQGSSDVLMLVASSSIARRTAFSPLLRLEMLPNSFLSALPSLSPLSASLLHICQRVATPPASPHSGQRDLTLLRRNRWKKSNSQAEARQAAESFRIAGVRKTELKQVCRGVASGKHTHTQRTNGPPA